MKKQPLLFPLLLSLSLNAAADEQVSADDPALEGEWAWSMSVTSSVLDDSVLKEGIDDSAFGFSLDADYLRDSWITSLSVEYLEYDDNASFSQEVVGSGLINKGDRSSETSDASGLLLGVATGPLGYFGENNDIAWYAQGGFNFMINSERSIGYCDNCDSEDIDIEGGLFVKVGIIKNLESFSIGLHAKQYVISESLGSTIYLSAGTKF